MNDTVKDVTDTVTDKIADLTDGVEIKKLNVEVQKDGTTYKLDVNPDGSKVEVK